MIELVYKCDLATRKQQTRTAARSGTQEQEPNQPSFTKDQMLKLSLCELLECQSTQEPAHAQR